MAWYVRLVAVLALLAASGVIGGDVSHVWAQEAPAVEKPAETAKPATAQTETEAAKPEPAAAEPPAAADEPAAPPADEPAIPTAEQPADETVAAPTGAPAAEEPAAEEEPETDFRHSGWAKFLVFILVIVVSFGLGGLLSRRLRMPDYFGKITLVLFCVLASTAITVMGWPPKLGIDLSGGVILVYEVEGAVSDQPGGAPQPDQEVDDDGGPVDMDKLIGAISRRVNPGGVKEVTIRKHGGNEVEIIVPEVDENEVARLKRILNSVGILQFRIVANRRDHASLIERADAQQGNKLFDAQGKLLAWWSPVSRGQEGSFISNPEIATRERTDNEGQPVLEVLVVNDNFNVNGGYLTRASESMDQSGRPCVNFQFNNRGGQLFAGLTSNNLPDEVQDFYRLLGIILDDYLYSAPRIITTIRENGQITGEFSRQEVDDLVAVLNAGSLPAKLSPDPISELVTGPTLGMDTVRKGSAAIAFSLVLVLVFMIFYYRFSGIIACMAVLSNLVMLLAIMITVKAAFTLPGIAGLVLTVGMAVDANVLIFERIREELDRQATLRMAIRNGFSRALSAIVDANVTTLITGVVLYVVGTDQVKGFAVTLILGVTLSMFTAIFCARVVFDIAEKQKWITKLSMVRILGGTNIDFLGKRRVAAAVSITLILIGVAAVVARGKSLLDIDFTGGASVEIVFSEPQKVGDVRDALADLPDLAVSNVQLTGEPANVRFLINTSSPPDVDGEAYLEQVRQKVADAFGRNLLHYSMSIDEVEPIAAGPATGGGKADSEKQSRSDLPSDNLLASADPAAVLLAQADAPEAGSPEKPEEEAEPAPAEKKPVETPAAADAEDPSEPAGDKPDAKPAETPAPKPTEKPAAETPAPKADEATGALPAESPAEKPDAAASQDRFAGGTKAELHFEHPVSHDTLVQFFKDAFDSGKFPSVGFEVSNPQYVPPDDDRDFADWNVKVLLPEEEAQALFASIKDRLESTPVFPSSSSIGGKVAGTMQVRAVMALLASLVFIVGYIWVRFQRVMYGLAAVVALVHDVLVTLGAIAISAFVANYMGFLLITDFKIGLSVLAAFLTIIGYSLNDTIVVFDRIREVKGKLPHLTEQMVNTSINQTLSRTLLTSFTTLLVVVILYIGGGQGIHAFAFSLLVGVIVGTYSSVFVASPILVWMSHPGNAKQA